MFADRLPGFPDNLTRAPDGTFWVAFFTTRNPAAAFLGPRPWLRSIVAKLPQTLWPRPARVGLVAQLSEAGEVMQVLRDPDGSVVANVTGVRAARGGRLVLGTLLGDRVWEAAY